MEQGNAVGEATGPEAVEETVRRMWAQLSPGIDKVDEEILGVFLSLGASTPYRVAKHLCLSTASVYRRARKLLEKRVLIPVNDDKLMASIKGCIVLYTRGRMDLQSLVECARRIWGVRVEPLELLGFLHLLGLEAQKRRLQIQTLTMCRVDEASVHALRYLREALLHHLGTGTSFAESLDAVAARHGVDPAAFREGLRLALRGISTTLPIAVTGHGHRVVILTHDRFMFHFVVECSRPCEEYRRSLGVECPIAARLVKQRLAGLAPRLLVLEPHGQGHRA